MGRFVQDCDSKGSLKDLQILINDKSDLLDVKLESIISNSHIQWVSPLKSDDYAEYSDEEFLEKLGIASKIKCKLGDFWPRRGPQWDALGKLHEKVFLVEAKANIPEIVSPGTTAGIESKSKIMDAFCEVKEYLDIYKNVDWTGTFYQYVNRIAHLYYLRVLNNIDAHLINVYFMNDDTVDESPKTDVEWKAVIRIVKLYLGIPKSHKLSKYIHDVFIDIKELG